MDNCEVKFGELTRTVATKNITISALVALSISMTPKHAGYVVFLARSFLQMKMMESFGVYELDVSRVSEISRKSLSYKTMFAGCTSSSRLKASLQSEHDVLILHFTRQFCTEWIFESTR